MILLPLVAFFLRGLIESKDKKFFIGLLIVLILLDQVTLFFYPVFDREIVAVFDLAGFFHFSSRDIKKGGFLKELFGFSLCFAFIPFSQLKFIGLFYLGLAHWFLISLFFFGEGLHHRRYILLPLIIGTLSVVNFSTIGSSVDLNNYLFYARGLEGVSVAQNLGLLSWISIVFLFSGHSGKDNFVLSFLPLIAYRKEIIELTQVGEGELSGVLLVSIIWFGLFSFIKNREFPFKSFGMTAALCLEPFLLLLGFLDALIPLLGRLHQIYKKNQIFLVSFQASLALFTALLFFLIVKSGYSAIPQIALALFLVFTCFRVNDCLHRSCE